MGKTDNKMSMNSAPSK